MKFAQAINEALSTALAADPQVICLGLGVDDCKGVFGTTLGLKEKFGGERVFDIPTSENGMTGIAIGGALAGLRPVMTHQRLDFALLSLDQIINNAAKWFYMFGGQRPVPLTIRMILGRGWGQGPTHSQNLQSVFAHIPGLKVVMPSTPENAKGLLLASIFDPNPVIFLEHRWLHNMEGEVPKGDFRIPLGLAKLLNEGRDLTIVSMSYMTVEALHALPTLQKNGIEADLIDLQTISPLDWATVMASVQKTGRLLVLDTGNEMCSVAGEIIAKVCTKSFGALKAAPERLCLPHCPTPTSFALTKDFYMGSQQVIAACQRMLGKEIRAELSEIRQSGPHDVPGQWFKGPF